MHLYLYLIYSIVLIPMGKLLTSVLREPFQSSPESTWSTKNHAWSSSHSPAGIPDTVHRKLGHGGRSQLINTWEVHNILYYGSASIYINLHWSIQDVDFLFFQKKSYREEVDSIFFWICPIAGWGQYHMSPILIIILIIFGRWISLYLL